MRVIGIDIGTTTICSLVYDTDTGSVLGESARPNTPPDGPSGIQDPELILRSVEGILEEMGSSGASAIGFSSQMHGILYVDREGRAVSPFYTWQNQWGKGLEDALSEDLGYRVYTGYGLVTHKAMPALPEGAERFCNIGDYVAMRLTGRTVPLCDASIAASLGIWNVQRAQLTEAFPGDRRFFPDVVEEASVAGCWHGIPVITALGDNQCSFLGSVLSLREDVVLSYGTSGQISFCSSADESFPGFEQRPLGKGVRLQAAFSLAGGESFQLLAAFFQEVTELCGLKLERPMYEVLDGFSYSDDDKSMRCEPFFLGERGNSSSLASFSRITAENFRPKAMAHALLEGMAWELFRFYEALPEETRKSKKRLIGTGNGLRKNAQLQKIVEEMYGMPLVLREIREGSCVGAVMNALVALGHYGSYEEAARAMNGLLR